VTRTTVARQQSRRISGEIRAYNGFCWQNAIKALRRLTGGKLAIGWARLASGRRVEHAWVELADGRIVDPTPSYIGRRGVKYQALKRYTRAEVAKSTVLDLVADAFGES
jgi:hypothetical protein